MRITVRALTWVTERTVAAVSQGNPNSPQSPPREPISSRSRWKPEPLSSLRAFWLTMSLQGEDGRGLSSWAGRPGTHSRDRLVGEARAELSKELSPGPASFLFQVPKLKLSHLSKFEPNPYTVDV